MKLLSRWLPFLFLVPLLTACEKAIDLDLNEVEPKLVVEATIENGQPPVVYLTSSLAYFSSFNASQLAGTFIRNAEVWVSDGLRQHRLKEYAVPAGPGLTAYFYSNDDTNPATAITGQVNTRYTLRIITGGREYNASTTIPDTTRRIDSLFWKPAPAGNAPGKAVLMLRATDRPGLGDYIRYYTRQNRDPFYPGLNSVYDDQVIDGSSYEVQVERGVPRSGSLSEGYSFFNTGDTVTLKLSNIDKATYDFWRTMEFSYASIGNPFSSPTRVLGNISGGALGYFGGYASQYRTIVIPR